MSSRLSESLVRTPLYRSHVRSGARMAEFAGHLLPTSFVGALEEHRHTRVSASLFDVSHMRVCDVVGEGASARLEELTPSRVTDLPSGRSRYLTLTNERGGVIDDTIVTRLSGRVRLVLNASRTEVDLAHLRGSLGEDSVVDRVDLGLVALQGPRAREVLTELGVQVDGLRFMDAVAATISGTSVMVSRSGYTGEDGFELTAHIDELALLADVLLDHEAVAPAGLAARDSLRLEAGLCLYGQELDEDTTPVEAGLTWTIPKDRQTGGTYLGSERIAAQVRDGVRRRLVGLQPTGRRPVRAGNGVLTQDGRAVGVVTSGGWGATVNGPAAMAYVEPDLSSPGTRLVADVRGSQVGCRVELLPFVPHRYVRGSR